MTQQRLINDIWRACNILRRDNNCGGVMDYVEHLSWLLFLKFLDGQQKPDQGQIRIDEIEPQYILDSKYRWSEWAFKALYEENQHYGYESIRNNDNLIRFVRHDLLPYLSTLSGSPERDLIASIFKDRNVVVCASVDNLKEVLKIVDDIDFEHGDGLNTVAQAYEGLLQKLGSENKMVGEFYTPRPVIRFIVKAIDPKVGETIYDPSCGSGGFLVETYDYLKAQIRGSEHDEALQRTTIFGQVKNAVPALFSVLNMLLHGAAVTSIGRRNALEEDTSHISSQFDVILTNPPFGGTENTQVQQNFPIKSNATELLYLEHIMKKLSLRDGARCGMVVPEGVLFRRDAAFTSVKEKLLTSFSLFMVVSLPPGVFAPYSGVKTSLLFFEWPGPTTEILYYKIPPFRGTKSLNGNGSTIDAFFNEALKVYRSWRAYRMGSGLQPQLTSTCWIETLETLTERRYDLSAKNSNDSVSRKLPRPSEIIAVLIERHQEFYKTLEHLHEIVSNREDL